MTYEKQSRAGGLLHELLKLPLNVPYISYGDDPYNRDNRRGYHR